MVASLMLIVAAAQQAAPPPPKPEAKICRSRPVTGSRAKTDRTCHTKAEWEVIDSEQRRVSGQIIDQQRLRNLGN